MTKVIPKKAYKEKEKRNKEKKKQTELALPSIPKISQSLSKSLYKYKMGKECGIKIQEIYINKHLFPPSQAQSLGIYFEYIATQQLPKSNEIPQATLLKNGKLTLPYARMEAQKNNFIRLMERMNFTIEKTGHEFSNPKYSGVADIIAIDNNIKSKDVYKKRIIIDLKTSALLNNKWSEYGWADESIEEKDELLIQAIHYKMLANYEWGIEDIPFYFFVFSTLNEWEFKAFKINVDGDTYRQHYNNLQNIKTYLDTQIKLGFKPHPSLTRCNSCVLRESCLESVDIPNIQEVYV